MYVIGRNRTTRTCLWESGADKKGNVLVQSPLLSWKRMSVGGRQEIAKRISVPAWTCYYRSAFFFFKGIVAKKN